MTNPRKTRYLLILSLVLSVSVPTSAQDNSHLDFFLTSLNQSALDSTTEAKNFYPSGVLKEMITVMHSHYYAFDVKTAKNLKKTFIKVKNTYNAKGVLIRIDSLAPPEQGYYYEKFLDANTKSTRVVRYDFSGHYRLKLKPDATVSLPKDFTKASEESMDKNGKRTSQFWDSAPLRYVVHQRGDFYDITNNLYEGEYRDYDNKYVTFDAKKRHLEIQIIEPKNDSVLCTLKYKFDNGFVKSEAPDKIKDFVVNYVRVYSNPARIELYDQQTKKNFILDYDFEKILNEPVESCNVVTHASTQRKYYWICNGMCGLYDLRGKNVIPMQFGQYVSDEGDYLKVTSNRQYSCIDYKGNVIIPYRSDIEDFTLYPDNVAGVFTKDKMIKGKRHFYLNLNTRDTIQMYSEDKNPYTNSDAWKNIKTDKSFRDFKVIQDTLAFVEINNPRHYGITGADRLFWWQKYVLKLPDSLQNKTDLLTRHKDFDPVEYKYVLYNLKTHRADTIEVTLKALGGNPAYTISIDDSFVNGYARLEIAVGDSYQKFYSLLSSSGKVIDVLRQYSKIQDVNNHGQAIVQYKVWKGTSTSGVHIETNGVIDLRGEEIVPCEYSSCTLVPRYGYRVFTSDSKWGLIDFDGEMLVKPDTTHQAVEDMIDRTENPFLQYITVGFK